MSKKLYNGATPYLAYLLASRPDYSWLDRKMTEIFRNRPSQKLMSQVPVELTELYGFSNAKNVSKTFWSEFKQKRNGTLQHILTSQLKSRIPLKPWSEKWRTLLEKLLQLSVKSLFEKAKLRQVPVTGSEEAKIWYINHFTSRHFTTQCLRSLHNKQSNK